MKPRKLNKRTTGLLILLLVVVAGGAVYAMTRPSSSSTGNVTTPQPKGPQTDKTYPSASPAKSGTPATPTPVVTSNPSHPVSATLAKPTGQTLNKHTISLSSNDLQNNAAMTTSCQTVIGGLCGLTFSGPGGAVKQVDPSATQSGGNQFDWNAKTLGLAPGTWQVQLLATYNGQTGVGDASQLMVNP